MIFRKTGIHFSGSYARSGLRKQGNWSWANGGCVHRRREPRRRAERRTARGPVAAAQQTRCANRVHDVRTALVHLSALRLPSFRSHDLCPKAGRHFSGSCAGGHLFRPRGGSQSSDAKAHRENDLHPTQPAAGFPKRMPSGLTVASCSNKTLEPHDIRRKVITTLGVQQPKGP
jgi:hypothetical protein